MIRKLLLLGCPLLLLAATSWGSTCAAGMLSTYTASGFTCTEGDLLFSNFSYFTGTSPSAGSVMVTPTNDGTDLGFFFESEFQSLNAASSDAVLGYQISTLDGSSALTGNTLSLVGTTATGGGSAQVVEGICTAMPSGSGVCPSGSAYSTSASSGTSTGSVVFASPSSLEVVSKNIITNGGGGSATISNFESTVEVAGGATQGAVPEPGPAVSIGSGLILASLLLRKKFGHK